MSATLEQNSTGITTMEKEVYHNAIQLVRAYLDYAANRQGFSARYTPMLENIERRLNDPFFNVALIGNMNTGKSTFLNAMMGTRLLKTASLATTAVPTMIRWNAASGVTLALTAKSGACYDMNQPERRGALEKSIGRLLPNELHDLVDTITTDNRLAPAIRQVELSLPDNPLYRSLCVIDTPGVNAGDPQAGDHVRQTQNVLREYADAAIVLFPATQVFTASFAEFLEQSAAHLMDDAAFIVTMMDILPEKDREELLVHVRKQLESHFGLTNPTVYGCAANLAIDAATAQGEWGRSFRDMLHLIVGKLKQRRRQILSKSMRRLLSELLQLLSTNIEEDTAGLTRDLAVLEKNSLQRLEAEHDKHLRIFLALYAKKQQQNQTLLQEEIAEKISTAAGGIVSRINACTMVFEEEPGSIPFCIKHHVPAATEAMKEEVERVFQRHVSAMAALKDTFLRDANRILAQFSANLSQIGVSATTEVALRKDDEGADLAIRLDKTTQMELANENFAFSAGSIAAGVLALPLLALDIVFDSDLASDAFDWLTRKLNKGLSYLMLSNAQEKAAAAVRAQLNQYKTTACASALAQYDKRCEEFSRQACNALAVHKQKYSDLFRRKNQEFLQEKKRLEEAITINKQTGSKMAQYIQLFR